ncbi:MAG: glycosyl hydrolase 115 family protein [Pirellulales bacterium]|nr:glycosyl hydrolase 115 family protein [Pirellulales bacterium]
MIDGLVAAGKIDVSAIKGKWEAYIAVVVDNPMAGVNKALIIAGSDRRGTAFGVFGLSESMGVSPWYWWADVAVPKKEALYVAGSHTQPSPGVKYRGIFLNDEDWGLQPWAARTFEPEVGNIGPKTYAAIFELLLRLHANCIWPAMHEFPVHTTPFYLVPGNAKVADEYAIIISTSHHEPMLTNSHEYNESVHGPYDYWTNRDKIYKFWEDRVRDTGAYENIYTMGMRGRSDAGMSAPRGSSMRDKAAKIQNEIIPDQRRMIADHVNKDPSEVPQIFIPYKETLLQYQAGLQLPDDITIVWPDDNHGYIRQLSTAAERKRSGGSGIYYHLSYWGVPSCYLWFCSTPPGMTRTEMLKAWDFEARNIWIVNVGDLKPIEIGMEFFLRMARNPEAFRNFDQTAYFTQWAARNFNPAQANAIADVLNEYFRLNILKRPEHVRRDPLVFSLVDRGDEAWKRLEDFTAMTAAADAIYSQLPEEQKPSFYELILYPVRASHLVNRRDLLAERSRLWAAQKRAATNELAAAAKSANDMLFAELRFYNEVNAGGKWNHMLSPAPQTQGWVRDTQNAYLMPEVGSYSPPAPAALGVAVEGTAAALESGEQGALPVFNPAADQRFFIDVFNQGMSPMKWSAQTSAPWIVLSQTEGSGDARIMVSIDWDKAPYGNNVSGAIAIGGAGTRQLVNLVICHPLNLNLTDLPDAVEDDGIVVIEAENYADCQDGNDGTGWRRFDQTAASDDGMTIQPFRADSLNPGNLPPDAPSLTYKFHSFNTGSVKIQTQCLPTHRITSDHPGVRYAISLNGDAPQIIDVNAIEYSPAWNANTMRAASIGTSSHKISKPGLQTIQIRMVDAGVVLDKLTVRIASGIFEAEDLTVQDSNAEVVAYTDPPASEGAGLHIKAEAKGDFATVVIPDVKAGDYKLAIRVKKWNSRGIVQMAVAENPDGPYEDIGAPYDLYEAAATYSDLEILPVGFASGGPKYLRFTVTGKNPSSNNYWILLDYITLKPAYGGTGK